MRHGRMDMVCLYSVGTVGKIVRREKRDTERKRRMEMHRSEASVEMVKVSLQQAAVNALPGVVSSP